MNPGGGSMLSQIMDPTGGAAPRPVARPPAAAANIPAGFLAIPLCRRLLFDVPGPVSALGLSIERRAAQGGGPTGRE